MSLQLCLDALVLLNLAVGIRFGVASLRNLGRILALHFLLCKISLRLGLGNESLSVKLGLSFGLLASLLDE